MQLLSLRVRQPGIVNSALAFLLLFLMQLSASPAVAQHRRPENLDMPGESYRGPLPELSSQQKELADQLKSDLAVLSGDIGERNVTRRPQNLARAADFLADRFTKAGYRVQREVFRCRGQRCENIFCQIQGSERPGEIVVIGAHYDSAIGAPGANDNGSGTVALLALARSARSWKPKRTLRLVALTNEESPHFQSGEMGSYVHAREAKRRGENIVAMLSLETIGYYSDRAGSQRYPAPLNRYYPTEGNFIAFVSNSESEDLLRQTIKQFRAGARFPSEGAALPAWMPGVGWSDHWSFWQFGYPGVMVTDTAPFRYPHYHKASDTPDKIDYRRMALVVDGLRIVLRELCQAGSE